jgi:RimJ/RimL family protein N-acetyltransferase
VVREPRLRTARLLLRRWRADDLDAFAELNADPAVMKHFPAPLQRHESAELMERIEACFQQRGYGLWAVEVPEQAPLIGFVGLWPATPPLPFAPAVELGWRVAAEHWGRGLAREAAAAAADFAYDELGLHSLLAYAAARNLRSRRLMDRLGMRRDPAEDFDHPGLERGHPLAPHVLYRLDADDWRRRRA